MSDQGLPSVEALGVAVAAGFSKVSAQDHWLTQPLDPAEARALDGRAVWGTVAGLGHIVLVARRALVSAIEYDAPGTDFSTVILSALANTVASLIGTSSSALSDGSETTGAAALAQMDPEQLIAVTLYDGESVRGSIVVGRSLADVAAVQEGAATTQPPEAAAAAANPSHQPDAMPATFDSLGPAGSPYNGTTQSVGILAEVEMGVTVELGRTRLSVRDILGLTLGSVIELDRPAGAPVDVLVNGTLIARGEVVVIDEEFGIRVSEVVGPPSDGNRWR